MSLPNSTTTDYLARWGNASGTALKSSSVRVDDSANIFLNGIALNEQQVEYNSGRVVTREGSLVRTTTTAAAPVFAFGPAGAPFFPIPTGNTFEIAVVAIAANPTGPYEAASFRLGGTYQTFSGQNPTGVGTQPAKLLSVPNKTPGATGWVATMVATGTSIFVHGAGASGADWRVEAQVAFNKSLYQS